MEISEEELKNQLALSLTGIKYDFWVDAENGKFNEKLITTQDAQKILDKIDKQYADANPTLSNIRTESVDDKLCKTECVGDIEYKNGNKTPIEYKLSITSEGELYAEVFF